MRAPAAMTAANYLANARRDLDAVEQLLHQAAKEGWPAQRIAERALEPLREARQILETLSDEEGTE